MAPVLRPRALLAILALVLLVGAGTSCASGGDQAASGGTAAASVATAPGTTQPRPTGKGPAVPSAGCGSSAVGALDKERRTMAVGGAERFYLLTTPAAHDGKTPLPLVVDFHGLLEGAQIHAAMSRFSELGQADGFVVATPNGSGEPIRWDVKPDANQDLAFIDAMLDQLGQDLCVDTSRVYATGLSYGAIMTSFLTCQRADRFAAVAPVAGLMVPTPCDQARHVPILTFHGTDDPILTFNGGTGSRLGGILGKPDDSATTETTVAADINGKGYPANAATWAQRNGCQPTPTDTKVSAQVIHRVYDCPPGAAVEFFIVLGGGHSWPASEFSKSIENVVGPTTFDIDATKEAWAFFQRYQNTDGR